MMNGFWEDFQSLGYGILGAPARAVYAAVGGGGGGESDVVENDITESVDAGIDIGKGSSSVTGSGVVATEQSASSIRALQTEIVSSGCELRDYGVDGLWGSETRTGVQCLADRIGGLEVVYARYPFVRGLMSGPTSSSSSRAPTTPPPTTSVVAPATSFWSASNPLMWVTILGGLAVVSGAIYAYRKYADEGLTTSQYHRALEEHDEYRAER